MLSRLGFFRRGPATQLDWVSRPIQPGVGDRLSATVRSWFRKRAAGRGSACPVCLAATRSGSVRCPSCHEDLVLDDPAAALRRLSVEWPDAEVVLPDSLPEGFGDVDPERLRLRELVEELVVTPGDANAVLRCLSDQRLAATVERYPHQIGTVRRALGELGGRALLADEVGLRKTIEASLVLAELRSRGL